MQVEQRVSQRARDTAASLEPNGRERDQILRGKRDKSALVQAFASFEASLPPSAPVDRDAVADAILANLRDRDLFKYLFHEEPERCGAYGRVDAPIDLETQREIALSLASVLAESTSNDCLLVAEGWQDIASAPKDGRTVDLWWDGIRFVDCFWMDANEAFPNRLVGWVCTKSPKEPFHLSEIRAEPTHWRPLPAPPAVTDLSGVGVG